MNIELDGKLALIGGAAGPLSTAIRQALADNGARVLETDPANAASPSAAIKAASDPFVLVLVSRGADGLPDADADFATERRDFSHEIRRLAPKLKRVVIVFSAAGLVPVKGFAEFSADQAALASLTRSLAMDLGPPVVVNAVCVGAYDAGPADMRTPRFLSHAAVKRPAQLAEIVAAVLFLADPENSYMTGHTLNIDGGWAAGYARNF